MAITLRSVKELKDRKEDEKKKTGGEVEKQDRNETGIEKKQHRTELTDEGEQLKEQNKQKIEEAMRKKDEVRVYQPLITFP